MWFLEESVKKKMSKAEGRQKKKAAGRSRDHPGKSEENQDM